LLFEESVGRTLFSASFWIGQVASEPTSPLFTEGTATVKVDIAENREGFVKVTFFLSYKFLLRIYEFFITRYYGSIAAVNKIFLQNYLFFG